MNTLRTINTCYRITGSIKKVIFNTTQIMPHLDCADIIYDKPDSESFRDWFEKVQI